MSALSFSCTEILESLLNHKKVQTIRPLTDSKPRLKVGDICKIYWKQRTSPKGSIFCRENGLIIDNWDVVCGDGCCSEGWCKEHYPKKIEYLQSGCSQFPKLMGEVKITNISIIEFLREDLGGNKYSITARSVKTTNPLSDNIIWVKDTNPMNLPGLAERDGFKSAQDMFKWFDNKYDLSQPKRFVAYRWKWLDD